MDDAVQGVSTTGFDALREFLPKQQFEYELVVAHPTTEWVSTSSFDELFGGTPVTVSHLEIPEVEQETLFLFQNGDIVASSPVWALTEVIAEINIMLRGGSVIALESLELPSVLTELDETPFAAAGRDGSSLKLLFTTISRYIEATAVKDGDGQLRVGFQRLSRLRTTEEGHTRRVYERLAETDVDVHVYGRPDWLPPESLAITTHGGYSEDFLRNWFLVYRSADGARSAAFTAHEYEKGIWCGHWTFDADRVSHINRYLEQRL